MVLGGRRVGLRRCAGWRELGGKGRLKLCFQLDRPIYPKATHEAPLALGGVQIDCAVLDDGTRVLSRAGFVRAIGRKGKVKGGDAYAPESKLPIFLGADNLKPFITNELTTNSNPLYYKRLKGGVAMGYRATLLTAVCKVFLKARQEGKLLESQKHIAKQCEDLLCGFADIGIEALVDKVTGFSEIRDRRALQIVLKHYIDGALYEWTETFPVEFFKGIFRLKGWQWNSGKMPQVVGKYVNDLVYRRLTAGLLEELKQQNPANENGNRRYRNHQFFSNESGHPMLTRRIYELMGMMHAFKDGEWSKYLVLVDLRFPKLNSTLSLPLND